ncbi:hypothetical protein [Streptomyces sp. SJL17-1]|uniref:hypothetical protein n=1 Tax=unclassified Streptomyces TaxID=2593676 RepID=UPI00398FF339
MKCTTVLSQAPAYTVSAFSSPWSTARPQRSFVAVHSPTYRQWASARGGIG